MRPHSPKILQDQVTEPRQYSRKCFLLLALQRSLFPTDKEPPSFYQLRLTLSSIVTRKASWIRKPWGLRLVHHSLPLFAHRLSFVRVPSPSYERIIVFFGNVFYLLCRVDHSTDNRAIDPGGIGCENDCSGGLGVGRIEIPDLRRKTILIDDEALVNRTATLLRRTMEEMEG